MKMNNDLVSTRFYIGASVALALSGCGGDEPLPASVSAPAQTFSLSSTIKGLNSSGLVLAVDGSQVTVAMGATSANLVSGLSSGSAYAVSVATPPAGENCSVAGGTGTIGSANVGNVVVTCSDQSFALGGSISGLNGAGLVLTDGTDVLTVSAGATSFAMPTQVAYTSNYNVTVKTQPAGLTCSISSGTGTMPASAVANIAVSCSDQPFTVGGTIAGLGNNTGLVLSNGTNSLTVSAGATGFTMPTAVPFASQYNISTQSSPAGLTCSVANGSGTMGATNVTGVTVTCSDQSFSLGGTIAGLTQAGLVLGNGADTLTVPAGANTFTMHAPVAYTAGYDVQLQTNPTGETCAVSRNSGTMPNSNVANVSVTCSTATYTIGGSISGLGTSGLVLLDNGSDATHIAANAGMFTMNTGLPYNSTYAVTVGAQPYGISLACTPTQSSGTATAAVSSIVVTCATVAPIQTAIAGWVKTPIDAIFDSNGDMFVADYSDGVVKELRYQNGGYGAPVTIASGFITPQALALDASDNLFVADKGHGTVAEVPYTGGSYGTPITIASGFNTPEGIAVDGSDNVFVGDTGNNAVKEIPNTAGSYGSPVIVGSGFSQPREVAIDRSGNLFVADYGNNAIKEIPYSGTYGTPVALGSGWHNPLGVSVDANGNVYVADTYNGAVKEIPLSGGVYGAPVTLASGITTPYSASTDPSGNVYVTNDAVVLKIPFTGGSFGTLVPFSFATPHSVVSDSAGNLYVADYGNNAVEKIPYSNGAYGAPQSLGSGFSTPFGVAVDAAGDVFVADTGNAAVKEIPYSGGAYGSPVTLGGGFSFPDGIAVDAAGNVFVADNNNGVVKEIPYANGTYGAPTVIGSGFSAPQSVAVDAGDNVFVADSANNVVVKIPYANGTYGATATIASGFNAPYGVTVDAYENLFVADANNNAIREIPYSAGAYGSMITIGSGLTAPLGVAVDMNGRLFAIDANTIWMFTP